MPSRAMDEWCLPTGKPGCREGNARAAGLACRKSAAAGRRLLGAAGIVQRRKSLAWALSRLRVYQFHDTSDESRLRATCDVDDSRYMYSNGGNLAAMLHRLREEHRTRCRLRE